MDDRFEATAQVWRYDGPSAWHVLSLPAAVSADVKERFGMMSAGFGSLRVEARIGQTTWRTSIFYDKASGRYLLPLKADVRRAEGLAAGDEVAFVVTVA